MKIRNIVGPIPEPNELFGREDLIENLWRKIEANNILLLAPRRFGKSGVMRHVLLRPRAGYLPLQFDLEDVTSPEEFVWRVTRTLLENDSLRKVLHRARHLPAAVSDWVKETFDEIGFEGAKAKFKESVKTDWREAAQRMLLEMEKADQTVVFIFDEMPGMLENLINHHGEDVAREFLGWFRKVRLEQKDVLRRHRFIVAGSIGIDAILRRLNNPDKLNDFCRIYVEPLLPPVSEQLARDLAETLEIRWNDELTQELFHILGSRVPYFIHLFFSEIGPLPAGTRQQLTKGDLEPVYRQRVLGPTCKHYFEHYSARLKRYGPKGETVVKAILRSVAGSACGRVSRSALFDVYAKTRGKGATDVEFDNLLGDLEHDWYLVLDPTTNEYYFMARIVQDWWCRWYPTTVKGESR